MRPFISALSYVADYALGETTRSVRRQRLTYLNVIALWRMERALREVSDKKVSGAYLEFGVALGGSAVLISKAAAKRGLAFHGFDVFATIPAPTSEKDDAHSKERYDVIQSGNATGLGGDTYYGYQKDLFGKVCASMASYGVPVDGVMVSLHKGLFEDTWPKADIGPIAFAHIDCDWYDPVKFCLEAIADRISPGGIVLLDDYNYYAGARRATNEFLAARDDFVFEAGTNPILRKR